MNKVILCCAVSAALMATACQSDWRDGIPDPSKQSAQNAVTFTTSVSSARQASRADATLVNKGETKLAEGTTVGIFGAYTGQNTWSSLVKLSKEEDPTADEKKVLSDYYTANQLYNVPATVTADGLLNYSPLRFWPNNVLPSPATGHEYMTFWAYYPYNETSSSGEHGIAITPSTMGTGMGMGRVKFTMHPDASQQNDFLISAPVTDCNRDKYPLVRTDDLAEGSSPTYAPKPVPFRLYHMLAQVRFYAFIRGDDKMVYQQDGDADMVADETWLATQSVSNTITDAYGNVYTIKALTVDGGVATAATIEQTTRKAGLSEEEITTYGCGDLDLKAFVKLGLRVPDEKQCVRWDRENGVWDVTHSRRRANITYEMELNNIKTTATFYPEYDDKGNATIKYDQATTLGSATVNHYIMNPYWFRFDEKGQRYQLNDTYMFGNYEDTPANNREDASDIQTEDGINWATYTTESSTYATDPLHYISGAQASGSPSQEEELRIAGKASKHYNYFPGNILMVVPQSLNDDDVPHVAINAKGKITQWNTSKGALETVDGSARVTVNMLKMGISWESGFIYCYAFLDDLRPGDDKVRGPESITVLFNKDWYTDQW